MCNNDLSVVSCCTVPVVGDVAIGPILFTEDRFLLTRANGLAELMVWFFAIL